MRVRLTALPGWPRNCRARLNSPEHAVAANRTGSACAGSDARGRSSASRPQSCGDGAAARSRAAPCALAGRRGHQSPIRWRRSWWQRDGARAARDLRARVEPKFEAKAGAEVRTRLSPKPSQDEPRLSTRPSPSSTQSPSRVSRRRRPARISTKISKRRWPACWAVRQGKS